MGDETPIAAPADAPVEEIPQAVPPAPIVLPGPDEMMAKIKEKIAAANQPEPKKTDDKPADDEPKLNLPPKAMNTIARLQKEARELSAKVKELEPIRPDAEFGKAVRDLWKGTPEQRLEALAKLSGKDGTDVLAEMVTFFYERDQAASTPAGDAKPAQTAETKALMDLIGDLKKEVAELKSGRTTDETTRAKAQADEAKAAADAFVGRFLETNKAAFEISARKENVAEATELIQAAALAICERDRIDFKALTAKTAEDLYLKAAGEVEKEYEETGRRFAKATPKPVFDPDRYGRRFTRPAVVEVKEKPSNDPKVREQQLRDRLTRKLENGELGR